MFVYTGDQSQREAIMSNLFKPAPAAQLTRLSQQPVMMPIQPPQTAAPVVPHIVPPSSVLMSAVAPTLKSSTAGVRRPQPQLAALSSQLEVLPAPQQIPVMHRQDLKRDRDSGHYSWTSQQQLLATPLALGSLHPDVPGDRQATPPTRPTSEQQGRHLVKQQSLGGPAKYMQFMASEPITPTLPPPPFSPMQKSSLQAPVVNYTGQNLLPDCKQSYNSLQSASSSLTQPPTSVFTFQTQQTSTVAMSHQHSSSLSPSSSARPVAPPSYDEAAAAAASAHNLRRLHLQLQQNLREQQHRGASLLNSSSIHSLTSPPTLSRHRLPTASSVPGMQLEKDDEDEQVSAV